MQDMEAAESEDFKESLPVANDIAGTQELDLNANEKQQELNDLTGVSTVDSPSLHLAAGDRELEEDFPAEIEALRDKVILDPTEPTKMTLALPHGHHCS